MNARLPRLTSVRRVSASEDWYERLVESGLLDTLAPYDPAVVGPYPLGIAAPHSRIEIVCRATDLQAFARVVERAHGDDDGFALHLGTLDGESAVFAEFELDGLPVEVSAQPQHVNRRLAAATLGIARVFDEEGELRRSRLAAAVARGEDWLEAALAQTGLTRAGIEQLASAKPGVAGRVLGVRRPPPPLRDYGVPVLVGFVSQVLIVLALAERGSLDLLGGMLMLEAAVLGAVFGARLGMVAALGPIILIGAVIAGSVLVGSESCSGDCALQFAEYTFVAVLVASASGLAGLLRDRYWPR
jgi:hypothetical protein